MEGNVERENLATIQDFYSKRTVAHASFFLSSLFGLFSLLSLMTIVKVQGSTFLRTEGILILLLVPYGIVWFFGLYSLFNFRYYAAIAEASQVKMVGNEAGTLIGEALIKKEAEEMKKHKRVLRFFHRLMKSLYESKAGLPEVEKNNRIYQLNRHKMKIFLLFYIILGLLPLVTVWILS